jgi:hypothetical protein
MSYGFLYPGLHLLLENFIFMYTCSMYVLSSLSFLSAALERTPGDGADYSRTSHHQLSPLVSDFSKCEGAQYSSLDKVPCSDRYIYLGLVHLSMIVQLSSRVCNFTQIHENRSWLCFHF